MKFTDSQEMCRYIREAFGPTALLSFSTGKDSIACWLRLREHFDEIIPYYHYLVPGLEFVEESLAYYEQYFGTRIVRLPSPGLYRMISNNVFQPPNRIRAVALVGLKNFSFGNAAQWLRDDIGLQDDHPYALGVIASDSPLRRMGIHRSGGYVERQKKWYPIYDYKRQDVYDAIEREGIKLPVDYRMMPRSFDGLSVVYLAGIKKNYPSDYRKILEWFPLAELEVLRHGMDPKRKVGEEAANKRAARYAFEIAGRARSRSRAHGTAEGVPRKHEKAEQAV